MAAPKASRWIPVFTDFIKDLRINSKEVASEDDRGAQLVLWESQRRFLHEVATGLDDGVRHFYCLKSRQLGATTVSLAITVFWMAMHKNISGVLVTENEDNREKNRAIISRYIASFPEGFFGESFAIEKNNRQFISFTNGSRLDLKVAGTKAKSSTSWAEGSGWVYAHLTEVAAYGSADGLASLEEAFAQTNPNRLFIYESTAKGFSGPWRDKWLSGFDDPYTKRSWFLGWWSSDVNRIERSDPRFLQYGAYAPTGDEREKIIAVRKQYDWEITREQLAWIRWKENNAGNEADMLSQNQPWTAEEAFIQSGYSFFQTRVITKDLKRLLDNPSDFAYRAYKYEMGSNFFEMRLQPIENEREQGQIQLRVWEEPQPTARYVIGMDVAWGRNQHSDNTCISVWRCYADRLVQVAEFATAGMEVNQTAWVLAHLAGVYRDCVVNIEVNGPGGNIMTEWAHIRGQLNSELRQNIVRERDWEDALSNARWYLYHRPDSMGAGYAYNTMTNQRIGEQIMHGFRGYYVNGQIEIRSRKLLEEMAIVVVDEAGHIGARESKSPDSKDDRVYGAAFAIKAWSDWQQQPLLAEGMTYALVSATESGNVTPVSALLNKSVMGFFKTRMELEAMDAEPPSWKRARGLA